MLLDLTSKFPAFKSTAQPPQMASLRDITLFSQLSPRELQTINEFLHEREYIKGEIVFDEGDKSQAVYFILKGKVLICRQARPVDGVIADISAGQCFGEMALINNSPRMAQAIAAEDCTLKVLFREDFLRLIEAHSRIASKLTLELARMLAERLRQTVNAFVL
jgi:CRP/FNR family transcriptional regulator, cyclic AMP receptor protein